MGQLIDLIYLCQSTVPPPGSLVQLWLPSIYLALKFKWHILQFRASLKKRIFQNSNISKTAKKLYICQMSLFYWFSHTVMLSLQLQSSLSSMCPYRIQVWTLCTKSRVFTHVTLFSADNLNWVLLNYCLLYYWVLLSSLKYLYLEAEEVRPCCRTKTVRVAKESE